MRTSELIKQLPSGSTITSGFKYKVTIPRRIGHAVFYNEDLKTALKEALVEAAKPLEKRTIRPAVSNFPNFPNIPNITIKTENL